MVGDYFKVDSIWNILTFTDLATNLITWLRGKTFLIALIRVRATQNIRPDFCSYSCSYYTLPVRQHISVPMSVFYYCEMFSDQWCLVQMQIDLRVKLSLGTVLRRPKQGRYLSLLTMVSSGKSLARCVELFSSNELIVDRNFAEFFRHLRPLGIAANVTTGFILPHRYCISHLWPPCR